jgi:ubiquinone/menaquinone biosynthesis C-methylase UbiE
VRALLLSAVTHDLGAAPYDLLTGSPLWRAHAAKLVPPAPERPVRRVLDVGCGPGASAFALLDRLPGAEVIGLDRSPRMLARARTRARREPGPRRPSFVLGDALALPLGDGAVDLVTGHSLLYLLPDRTRALAELARVLAPGGALSLVEPSARGSLAASAPGLVSRARSVFASSPLDAARLGAALLAWRAYSGAVGRIDPDELAPQLAAAGFRDVAIAPAIAGLGLLVRAVRR